MEDFDNEIRQSTAMKIRKPAQVHITLKDFELKA